MKKNLIYFLVLLLFPAVLAACSEDDLSSTSVIQPPQVVQNDFDRWLDRHYLAPYNIEFQYRYTDIESSMGYYLTPADYNQSIALAKLAHTGDPKHCVIVLTASREIAEAADTLFEI